ncbi:MAG: alpha-amylase family protein [Roseiarcus sp.]
MMEIYRPVHDGDSAPHSVGWVEHAVFWQVYPLGFVGAEIRPMAAPELAHTLERLVRWLDYAVDLGVSGLLLGPIFASTSHGYDTTDHFRLDPRLGDESDFDALIEAARRRGLRIVLDGVFNHVSSRHPAFQDILANGNRALHARWFRPLRANGGAGDLGYEVFEGHRGLVALNHDSPEVADHVVAVMNHWLDRGVSGWRLDAAYAIAPRFWMSVLPRVRAGHPDAYFVAEMIHGDYAAFVRESGVDSVTQYELWKAIWSSLNDGIFFELAWALDRHNRFLESFVPQTFIGNHDVTRIASRLTDPRRLEHALAILLVCGGTSSIYAGDEQAFRGIKEERIGGDDDIRLAFPDSPEALAPYGWPAYRLHQRLIGLRRRHAWLHRAHTRIVHLANRRLTFESASGGERLVIALNIEGEGEQPAPEMRRVLAGQGELRRPGKSSATILLPEGGWAILGP